MEQNHTFNVGDKVVFIFAGKLTFNAGLKTDDVLIVSKVYDSLIELEGNYGMYPAKHFKLFDNKPRGHVHAERMKLYAEDAANTKQPWLSWEAIDSKGNVNPLKGTPMWHVDIEYRRKTGIKSTRWVNVYVKEVPDFFETREEALANARHNCAGTVKV